MNGIYTIIRVLILIFLCTVIGGCGLAQRRAERIQAQYPQWDQATIQAVAARKVATGMTSEMVEVALGKPDSVSQQGDEEKWTYGVNIDVGMGGIYRKPVYWVYFTGGKVVRTDGDLRRLGYW